MSSADLGSKRNYQTDFEIYDERAADHQNIVLFVARSFENHLLQFMHLNFKMQDYLEKGLK